MMGLVYPDTGVINRIDLGSVGKLGLDVAYSEATFFDLQNAESPSPELQRLNSYKAVFLSRAENEVRGNRVDAFKQFEGANRLEVDFQSHSVRFLNGGGPDSDLRCVVTEQFASLWGEDGLDNIRSLLGEQISKIEPYSNRDWESQIDRNLKSVRADGANPIITVMDGLNEEGRAALAGIFPKDVPGFDGVLIAALSLGIMGFSPTKGIRSRSAKDSKKTAEREYIDCMHIAYAMHCDVFITNDEAACARFDALKRYWNLERHAWYLTKEK